MLRAPHEFVWLRDFHLFGQTSLWGSSLHANRPALLAHFGTCNLHVCCARWLCLARLLCVGCAVPVPVSTLVRHLCAAPAPLCQRVQYSRPRSFLGPDGSLCPSAGDALNGLPAARSCADDVSWCSPDFVGVSYAGGPGKLARAQYQSAPPSWPRLTSNV